MEKVPVPPTCLPRGYVTLLAFLPIWNVTFVFVFLTNKQKGLSACLKCHICLHLFFSKQKRSGCWNVTFVLVWSLANRRDCLKCHICPYLMFIKQMGLSACLECHICPCLLFSKQTKDYLPVQNVTFVLVCCLTNKDYWHLTDVMCLQ